MGFGLIEYRSAIDALFARTGGTWRLGLDTTRELLGELGDPHRRYPSLHVAGTNGKGSVVHTLEALLAPTGLRIGRYTSPHLVDFRERIVVDGLPIPERDVVEWIERWSSGVERLGATFFEATTCMAFDYFAREGVQIAIVEVGLGGRLDATNVITPLVAGVTSIGLDHTDYLGNTLIAVAGEKAGIFKNGVPAVIGDPDREVAEVLASHAERAGATPVWILEKHRPVREVEVSLDGTSFTWHGPHGERRLTTPLRGSFQAANAGVALAMLELAGAPYDEVLADPASSLPGVSIPARFEWIGPFIFDVAHNPQGARALVQTLTSVAAPRPLVALLGVLGDKDWRGIIRELAPMVDRFVLAEPPSVTAARAWPLWEALAFARAEGVEAVAEPDWDRALAEARRDAATTLVTGSFHTVGDAMSRLPLSPLSG